MQSITQSQLIPQLSCKLLKYITVLILFSLSSMTVNAGNLSLGKNMDNSNQNQTYQLSETLLNEIKKTVQKQYKMPINQFEIVKVEKTDWPNSALGCPQSAMQYMQMITPGYLVKLKANGILHQVHTSDTYAVICGQSKPDSLSYRTNKKPKIEESTINRVKAIQLSRAVLIKTKEIETKQVRLKSVNDASISDFPPQCKKNYFGKDKGYQVVLTHQKLEVTFFSDGKEVVKCSSRTVL